MQPTARAGTTYGGNQEEYPQPWKLQYHSPWSDRRRVEVKSHVWPVFGVAIGASGHHHVTIREEDNRIWVEKDGQGSWGLPWDTDGEFAVLRGKRAFNDEFIHKRDVVKWAIQVLIKWGVIRNKEYKIEWNLDEDDPYAESELMRKRAANPD